MKHSAILFFLLCLFVVSAEAQTSASIDPAAPISLGKGLFTYQGKTVKLGPKSLLVDGALTEAQANQPYVYRTFQEAVAHLVDGTEEEPMRVYIAPWVYWLNDPDTPAVVRRVDGSAPIGMEVSCQNLHLIGLCTDARNVVLASQRGQTQGSYGNFTMVQFHGDGLVVENMTMGNFCNVDLEYPLRPTLGRKKRSATITQAHVAYLDGDRAVARNVRFISRLNMNPLGGATRILFDRCHLESTDDALTSTGVYLNCDLYFYGAKPFWNSDENGAAMLGCRIHAMHQFPAQFITKSENPIQLINCQLFSPETTEWSWTLKPSLWLRCDVANLTLNGRKATMDARHPWTTQNLEGRGQLRAFILPDGQYNLYNLLSGSDGWDPTGALASTPEQYRCMATAMGVEPQVAQLQTGLDSVVLTATPLRRKGLPCLDQYRGKIKWRVEQGHEGAVSLRPMGDFKCLAVPTNATELTDTFFVEAYTDEGLVGAVALTVRPSKLPAPTFVKKPRVRVGQGKATVDYQLQLGGRKDESVVDWYRQSGTSRIHIATSRNGQPTTAVDLSPADVGCQIVATVRPKNPRSDAGTPLSATSKAIKSRDVAETDEWLTDFSDFPTDNQPQVGPCLWTIDGFKPKDTNEYQWTFDLSLPMWFYGEGINGCRGLGLLQAQQGARLRYTPAEGNYGDMTVEMLVDPCKMAGQGFSSARAQYLDIGLKMDTQRLNGYALRIERTLKSSSAVSFTLMRYTDGVATPVSESIQSNCYVSGCRISVKMAGNTLSANVYNPNPLPRAAAPTVSSVSLKAQVEPNDWGGFLLQFTGTTGEGTTMLHSLHLKWQRK